MITKEDWIEAMTKTINAVGDPNTIQSIDIQCIPSIKRNDSWWMEAEVWYFDGSKTTVI